MSDFDEKYVFKKVKIWKLYLQNNKIFKQLIF